MWTSFSLCSNLRLVAWTDREHTRREGPVRAKRMSAYIGVHKVKVEVPRRRANDANNNPQNMELHKGLWSVKGWTLESPHYSRTPIKRGVEVKCGASHWRHTTKIFNDRFVHSRFWLVYYKVSDLSNIQITLNWNTHTQCLEENKQMLREMPFRRKAPRLSFN